MNLKNDKEDIGVNLADTIAVFCLICLILLSIYSSIKVLANNAPMWLTFFFFAQLIYLGSYIISGVYALERKRKK